MVDSLANDSIAFASFGSAGGSCTMFDCFVITDCDIVAIRNFMSAYSIPLMCVWGYCVTCQSF